jgi:RNA polymerase sigma factor (sigma-70 family)
MAVEVLPTLRDPSVTDLVSAARNGDKEAWDRLVVRYAPLVWSVCLRYRLGRAQADDVSQSVWLRLVEQLDRLREPAALPGWLVTTTQRECLRAQNAARRELPLGPVLDEDMPDQQTPTADRELLEAERRVALREAFTHLPPDCQQLISFLVQDPPVPYKEISARLGIPVGSIGPTRRRCLDKLRRYPAVAALINPEAGRVGAH